MPIRLDYVVYSLTIQLLVVKGSNAILLSSGTGFHIEIVCLRVFLLSPLIFDYFGHKNIRRGFRVFLYRQKKNNRKEKGRRNPIDEIRKLVFFFFFKNILLGRKCIIDLK